ncbi:hypothetical protein ACWC2K_30650 [Streptomyces chattanoogensis]|uniref:hypothetical protein n=1 Tax=Streptomyces chattanoogensis TaxID=66876 RepID=UPI003681A71E
MSEATSTDTAEELYARIQAAVEGTPYRMCRTEQGFDLTVDIEVPQWQELLARHRITKVLTYRVVLRPQAKTFTITDVVRTVEHGGELGGVRLGTATVSHGREWSMTWHGTLDGSEQYSFSSAEGHRLIRGAVGELGWRETQPVAVKIALGFAALGGLGGIAALIAVAFVKWL